MYDLISMFGINLFFIELPTLEFLIRVVFQTVTFRSLTDNKLKLRCLKNIKAAFTELEYHKVV